MLFYFFLMHFILQKKKKKDTFLCVQNMTKSKVQMRAEKQWLSVS